ncbi:MAG: hypothetical protein M1833_004309 [Piccolia ochrophora]|nr:MAG: hypothetical protein M1833_004309 [Piccolia ochrophora]
MPADPLEEEDRDSVVLLGEVKRSKLERVDFFGSITLAASVVAFLLAVNFTGKSLNPLEPLTLGLFVAWATLSVSFFLIEAYWAREPIVPLGLLAQPGIIISYIMIGLQVAAQMSMVSSVAIYFRITEKATNAEAGLRLMPSVAGNAAGGLLTGLVIRRTGRYKTVTILGCLAACSSYVLLITRWNGNTNFLESLYIFPSGFGMGVATAAIFVGLSASTKRSQLGIVGGGFYLAGSLGDVAGVSVGNALLQATLRNGLKEGLEGYEGKMEIIHRVLESTNNIWEYPIEVQDLVVRKFVQGIEYMHGQSHSLPRRQDL